MGINEEIWLRENRDTGLYLGGVVGTSMSRQIRELKSYIKGGSVQEKSVCGCMCMVCLLLSSLEFAVANADVSIAVSLRGF